MSNYRQLHRSFWESPRVEEMDPTEKLLYCYLITSPASNMEGLYRTSLKRIAFETGIDRDMVMQLCSRLESKKLGGFYNGWVCVTQATNHMPKSPQMLAHSADVYSDCPADIHDWASSIGYIYGMDTVSIPYRTRLDKTRQDKDNTDATPIDNTDADSVIAYLNEKTGKRYRTTEANRRGIRARLDEGYSVGDCKRVIDVKFAEWDGTEFAKHLTCETLFRPSKFDKYLNQDFEEEEEDELNLYRSAAR